MAKRPPPATLAFTVELPSKWFAAEFAIVIERAAQEQIAGLELALECLEQPPPPDKIARAKVRRRLKAWRVIQARALLDAHH